VQKEIPFSDPAIIEAFHLSSPHLEVRLSPDSYIVLKKIPSLFKPRPPMKSAEQYQLIFWEKEITVGVINWNETLNIPLLIMRLQAGKYKACSITQLKESLMKRSDSFREWLLWNLF
jgi:hypothetical protein